jgi:hypothetical protein
MKRRRGNVGIDVDGQNTQKTKQDKPSASARTKRREKASHRRRRIR